MTIEIFKYLVLRSSIDIIAGFNSADDTKKFLNTCDEPDELNVLIQDSLGIRSNVSFETFIKFY